MTEIGSLDALPEDEPYPGVHRRVLGASHATVTTYTFEPGAAFPIHRHPQEQITLITEGSVRMRIADDEHVLTPGAWAVVPGQVPHGITADAEGARITAIVSPRRSDPGALEILPT